MINNLLITTKHLTKLCSITLLGFLAACGDIEENPEEQNAEKTPIFVHAAPNKFITYVNSQAGLAAGYYNLAIDYEGTTSTFNYQLTIEQGGVSESIDGTWTNNSVSQHPLFMSNAGGVKLSLTGPTGASIAIVKDGQYVTSPKIIEQNGQVLLELNNSEISNEAYSLAYYKAVDPDESRATLDGFLQVNGFDQGDASYIVFRDTKDLGYGRSMYARQRSDGSIAFYVDNYVIKLGGSSPANYSPLNVHAAVDQNRKYHVSTNAIEFSPIDPEDPNSIKVAKFFTYGPRDEEGIQHRRLAADLDGRGVKPVPTTCISCHGGSLLPLNEDGSFPLQSLYTTKLNLLELNSFEYSELPGFTKQDQSSTLTYVNQLIYQTYEEQNTISDLKGLWSADFAIQVAAGHYDDQVGSNDYDPNFVPAGWKQNGQRPAGVELLYQEVVRPHCISCHSLRGTEIGESIQTNSNGQFISLANAVNFSNYEKFISYSDRIIDYVYRRGQMPLSLRNYEKFWQNPKAQPSLLASFLPGFNVLDDDNQVIQPGRPFAKITYPESVSTPALILGQHSLFADSFLWEVISKPTENAEINIESLSAPNLNILSATAGEYEFALTVTNDEGVLSEPVVVKLTISENVETLTFDNQIKAIMGSESNTSCSQCHRADSDYPNIPAYYDASNPNAYKEVRARVDFFDPENSPLLIKPTSLQHGGGIYIDRSSDDGEAQYQQLLSWIIAGAPCGTDPQYCG